VQTRDKNWFMRAKSGGQTTFLNPTRKSGNPWPRIAAVCAPIKREYMLLTCQSRCCTRPRTTVGMTLYRPDRMASIRIYRYHVCGLSYRFVVYVKYRWKFTLHSPYRKFCCVWPDFDFEMFIIIAVLPVEYDSRYNCWHDVRPLWLCTLHVLHVFALSYARTRRGVSVCLSVTTCGFRRRVAHAGMLIFWH